ncbi:MAG: hypothetical protein OXH02_08310 [Gemmatimonadetes bacterium]|nr:hypothetical protein [Gemmatimonadota bacterium]
MKLFTLSLAVVFALFFTGPPHDCDELESDADHAGHADHCQGCLFATAFSAVLEKSSTTFPDYEFVGPAAGTSQPGHPRIEANQHRNRSPPLP